MGRRRVDKKLIQDGLMKALTFWLSWFWSRSVCQRKVI